MQSSEYMNIDQDLYNTDELALETPIGWSSECLDQTINYYLDCNTVSLKVQNDSNE